MTYPIMGLPLEMQIQVFSYLNLKELDTVSLICKSCLSLMKQENGVYTQVLKRSISLTNTFRHTYLKNIAFTLLLKNRKVKLCDDEKKDLAQKINNPTMCYQAFLEIALQSSNYYKQLEMMRCAKKAISKINSHNVFSGYIDLFQVYTQLGLNNWPTAKFLIPQIKAKIDYLGLPYDKALAYLQLAETAENLKQQLPIATSENNEQAQFIQSVKNDLTDLVKNSLLKARTEAQAIDPIESSHGEEIGKKIYVFLRIAIFSQDSKDFNLELIRGIFKDLNSKSCLVKINWKQLFSAVGEHLFPTWIIQGLDNLNLAREMTSFIFSNFASSNVSVYCYPSKMDDDQFLAILEIAKASKDKDDFRLAQEAASNISIDKKKSSSFVKLFQIALEDFLDVELAEHMANQINNEKSKIESFLKLFKFTQDKKYLQLARKYLNDATTSNKVIGYTMFFELLQDSEYLELAKKETKNMEHNTEKAACLLKIASFSKDINDLKAARRAGIAIEMKCDRAPFYLNILKLSIRNFNDLELARKIKDDIDEESDSYLKALVLIAETSDLREDYEKLKKASLEKCQGIIYSKAEQAIYQTNFEKAKYFDQLLDLIKR